MKQSSLDEQEQLGLELESQQQENEEEITDDYRTCGNMANDDPSVMNNFNSTSNAPLDQSASLLQQRSGSKFYIVFLFRSCEMATLFTYSSKTHNGVYKETGMIVCLIFFQQFDCHGLQKCVKKISINFYMILAASLSDIPLLVIIRV